MAILVPRWLDSSWQVRLQMCLKVCMVIFANRTRAQTRSAITPMFLLEDLRTSTAQCNLPEVSSDRVHCSTKFSTIQHYGALIVQKFFVFYCFVFLLSGLYHGPKTTIEKNGVIWGTNRWRERVALPHFQHGSPS